MKKIIILLSICALVVFAWFFVATNRTQNVLLEVDPRVLVTQQAIETNTAAKSYAHPAYGFSFNKPMGYTVGSFVEAQGEMLVVQSNDGIIENDFQIFISPLSEQIELTPEFIKQDLPGTDVVEPKKIILDGKASGILFFSNHTGFAGGSFEIWFTYNNLLYQVTSYKRFSATLSEIIGTWKFN